jgi:predicted NUDIX family NTP pyrophosphohydrolase
MTSRRTSAGILLYRRVADGFEVFLAHPGGPFWARRDRGAWTVPKGEVEPGEDPLETALREFEEETGIRLSGDCRPLGEVRQKAGKVVMAWACQGDADPATVSSNTVRIEWPRNSGRTIEFPEIDRCAWCPSDLARERINPAQAAFIDRLETLVSSS